MFRALQRLRARRQSSEAPVPPTGDGPICAPAEDVDAASGLPARLQPGVFQQILVGIPSDGDADAPSRPTAAEPEQMFDDSGLTFLDAGIAADMLPRSLHADAHGHSVFERDFLHGPEDEIPPPRSLIAAHRPISITCEFRRGMYRPMWTDGPWILWNCPEESHQQSIDENLQDLDESEESEWQNTSREDAETRCLSPSDTHSLDSRSSEWSSSFGVD